MTGPAQSIQQVFSLIQSGQAEQALLKSDAALSQFPNQPNLLHLKAVALRHLNRLSDAIPVLQTAISGDPRNEEMLNTLGNMLKASGDLEGAVQAYRRAIDAKFGYAPAHKNLVNLLLDLEGNDEATSSVEDFLRATGRQDADALEAQGRLLKHRKAWRKALTSFDEALQRNPAHVAAAYGRASCLVEIGQTEACRDICLSLIQAGHQAPQILRLLARSQMELSAFGVAEPALQQAVAAGSSDAVKDYTNLLWMTGRTQDAETLLKGAISAGADRPQQALAGFDELLDMERPDLVESYFDYLPAERKTDPVFLSRLSMAQSDLGRTEEAFDNANIAYSALPHHKVLAYQFIVSCLMSGRYDLALKYADIWRAREPNDQSWVAVKADAHRMLGQLDAYHALIDFDRFVIPAELEVPKGYASMEEFHADFIEQVHGKSPFKTHPLGQSARQGIQSPRNLVYDERPVVQNYIEALHKPVQAYVDQLGQDPDNPLTSRNTGEFYIGGCWSIYLLAGGRHVSHVHPKGWVSSAYYMAVPPEAKTDPNRAGWIKFGEPPYKLPDPAPAEHWVCPKPGTLVLFPAYMWHGTVPISGKAPRVTAPLDVLPGVAP